MKRVTFTMLSLVLLLGACKKSDLTPPQAAATPSANTAASNTTAGNPDRGPQSSISNHDVVVTNWEVSDDWTRTVGENRNVSFSRVRPFPQLSQDLLDNGTVLLFSKGYNFADPGMNMPAMGMPFHFYLPIERMNFPVYFEYLKRLGAVDVNLKMLTDAAPLFGDNRRSVQFRYFLLSAQELANRGLTAAAAHNLSYQQLVNMYGLTP